MPQYNVYMRLVYGRVSLHLLLLIATTPTTEPTSWL